MYYGNRSYGIQAAAESYFGKPASQLSIKEATFLAGLLQSPSTYDPRYNMDGALARHKVVIDLMVKHGFLTATKASEIMRHPIELELDEDSTILAPHFVYYVKGFVARKYGDYMAEAGGLNIYTTLDLRIQDIAQQAVKQHVDRLRGQRVTNGAAVVMKPGTGEILAMVGSADYYNEAIDGEVNVTLSLRQPGSSIKPFTYAAAFMRGLSPATKVNDSPLLVQLEGGENYRPTNYDNGYHGMMTIREALGNSYNIPAVKAFLYAGKQEVLDVARAMGISTFTDASRYGPSLTLGGGEVYGLDMAVGYSTFANGGRYVAANPILKIVDASGKVLEELDQAHVPGEQAISPQVAYLVTSILSDNAARARAFGPNSQLRLSRPAAAKTGTTDNYRDNWTIGYTPYLTVAAWMGNSDNTRMGGVPGAIGAAYIWHDVMESVFADSALGSVLEAEDGALQVDFVRPEGVVVSGVCGQPDVFIEGAVPKSCPTLMMQPSTVNWPGVRVVTEDELPTPTATPTATSASQPSATPEVPWDFPTPSTELPTPSSEPAQPPQPRDTETVETPQPGT
jgi:membrane peptidoglycan carboxypeptidase